MRDSKPLIYVAISPTLFNEIEFDQYMPELKKFAKVECWPGPGHPTEPVMAKVIKEAEVLVTGWGTPSLTTILREWSPERSPLRLIAHTAGSIKFLLSQDLLERGLIVTHSNDSLAEAVAEFTLGSFISMRRQIILSSERYRAGQPSLPFATMRELPGSVIGIIGASAIGKRVMELLRPWNVSILLYDPYCTPETAASYRAQKVDLITLMQKSDIVSLHAPITPETINMLGSEHFAAMKEGALFVNTARGVLIDHDALLNELKAGRIWAILDVTDPKEPLPRDSEFFNLDNCVVLPHIAGASLEARQRQGFYMAEDIIRYFKRESPRFRITPNQWKTMA